MKLVIGSSLLFILFIICPKVKIVEATSQDWIGGRYETGRGTDYIVKMKARSGSDKLQLEKLWIGDRVYEVDAVKDMAKMSDKKFSSGDEVYIRAGKKIKPDENGNMIETSGKMIEAPKNFEGAALLVYKWKGKEKYLEIKEFKKLEKIIYP